MSKVFITGDVHRKTDIEKIYVHQFPQQKEMTKDDIFIIAGDAGIIWNGFNAKNNICDGDRRIINIYENRPFTTAFVDGNHENHPAIARYPIEMWHGGRVHRISKSIVHMMRGECYTINNKKFFVMGGARSTDKTYRMQYEMVYGEKVWWSEEMPSKEEYDRARQTIKENNNEFDYIITHCCSSSTQKKINPEFETDELTDFFDTIENVKFKKWFFGHYHEDIDIDDKHICMYRKIIEIE